MVSQLERRPAVETVGTLGPVVQTPRLMWTDIFSVATDSYLYVIANPLHHQKQYPKDQDLRRKAGSHGKQRCRSAE